MWVQRVCLLWALAVAALTAWPAGAVTRNRSRPVFVVSGVRSVASARVRLPEGAPVEQHGVGPQEQPQHRAPVLALPLPVQVPEVRQEQPEHEEGGGPVDATFKAIEQIAQSGAELLLYSVNNITSGTDAQGEVTVRLSKGGRIVNGQGADTDIVVASAKAYLNALNKLHSKLERAHPQV